MTTTISEATRSAQKRPHVLLLVESSRAYGRNCLSGIASYLRSHGPWTVLHIERGLQERVPAVIRRQAVDGILSRMETDSVASAIAEYGVPTVDLRGVIRPEGGVTLDTDSVACAEMAFKHFDERGFRQIGFCGYPGLNFSDDRDAALRRICIAHEVGFHAFGPPPTTTTTDSANDLHTIEAERLGEFEETQLIPWLQTLPRPIGVFCCNDVRGRQLLAAAAAAGIAVPEQVAVLGVDDDDVICELASPSLTSIEPDAHRIGYEGARILDGLMNGEPAGQSRILIPPVRISSRGSTDTIAIDDPDVVAAIEFIRNFAFESIGVPDVAAATSVSRATLERRFRDRIGRSPREELERVRVERIKLLLVETSYSLDAIAAKTGYKSASHVVTLFRRLLDCTPGQYRNQYQNSR